MTTQDDTLNRHRLCDGCGYALYECKCRATQDDTLKPCPVTDAMIAAGLKNVFIRGSKINVKRIYLAMQAAAPPTALAQEVERLKEALRKIAALKAENWHLGVIYARDALATSGIGGRS